MQTSKGIKLSNAFMQITDEKMKSQIVDLVCGIAEMEKVRA
jgi:hypothetical protein